MAPRSSRKRRSPSPDSNGIFHGMVVFVVEKGVQPARLQVWKRKLAQLGATIVDSLSNMITHVFAVDSNMLLQQVDNEKLKHFKGSLLKYQWLENCLKFGEKLLEDPYMLKLQEFEGINKSEDHLGTLHSEPTEDKSSDDGLSISKRTKISSEDRKFIGAANAVANKEMSNLGKLTGSMYQEIGRHAEDEDLDFESETRHHISFSLGSASIDHSTDAPEVSQETGTSKLSLLYKPPDLNKNITEIFGKLINIYRALGDDRRSFSYHKAIPVIEKLPFKIESIDQVKHLPAIGKSLQDHVRAVTLFGEVWGVGPATALKLYEKGHHTLDDLKNDDSLTSSQRLGVKYFDDIKKKIPRQEVKDMEILLQKAGHDVLPGVVVVCGGSYRRGKAFCGDLDIIITHPDGESHKGFLPRYVQYLKDIKFLREDLIFSVHSMEGTDSGVDTYFGLCTYPGREQRHRIDLKVYPRNIYAFGLIAWTGNDVLNRRLRLLADSKGYRLDDTGLFFATQSSFGKRGAKSSISVSCNTEKEVFDMLGFPWLEPHERNL